MLNVSQVYKRYESVNGYIETISNGINILVWLFICHNKGCILSCSLVAMVPTNLEIKVCVKLVSYVPRDLYIDHMHCQCTKVEGCAQSILEKCSHVHRNIEIET